VTVLQQRRLRPRVRREDEALGTVQPPAVLVKTLRLILAAADNVTLGQDAGHVIKWTQDCDFFFKANQPLN
jgi:hypothetical protein